MKTNKVTTGFFVDWDGVTRQVEAPGDGYTCHVYQKNNYTVVDVIDQEGFVTFEAEYYQTEEAIAERIAQYKGET